MHKIALPTWQTAKHGILLITVGLIKKTGADLLAIPAQKAFEAKEAISDIELWTGVIAFAGQIYGDFFRLHGYGYWLSTIARLSNSA